MILAFLFHPYIFKRQSLAEGALNMGGGGGKSFYNGTPGARTIVLPLFWCDLCSLKTNLENPSTIKRERSFLGENNSLMLDSQIIPQIIWIWITRRELLACFKTVSSALVKIQSERMRLKNKKLRGRSLVNQKQSRSRKEETATLGLGFHYNYVMGCTLGTQYNGSRLSWLYTV